MSAWQPRVNGQRSAHGPAHAPRRRGLLHRPGPRRRGRLVDAADRARRRPRRAALRRVPARTGHVAKGPDGAAEAAGRGGRTDPRAVPGTAGAPRVPADPARTRAAPGPGRPPGLGGHLDPGRGRDDGDDGRDLARGGTGPRAARHPAAGAVAAGPFRRAPRPGGGHPVHRPVLLPGRVRPSRVLPAGVGRDPRGAGVHPRIVHLPGPARGVRGGGRDGARGVHPAAGRAAGVRRGRGAPLPPALGRGARARRGAAAADVPGGGHQPAQAPDAGRGPRPDRPRGPLPGPGHRGERGRRPGGGPRR